MMSDNEGQNELKNIEREKAKLIQLSMEREARNKALAEKMRAEKKELDLISAGMRVELRGLKKEVGAYMKIKQQMLLQAGIVEAMMKGWPAHFEEICSELDIDRERLDRMKAFITLLRDGNE